MSTLSLASTICAMIVSQDDFTIVDGIFRNTDVQKKDDPRVKRIVDAVEVTITKIITIWNDRFLQNTGSASSITMQKMRPDLILSSWGHLSSSECLEMVRRQEAMLLKVARAIGSSDALFAQELHLDRCDIFNMKISEENLQLLLGNMLTYLSSSPKTIEEFRGWVQEEKNIAAFLKAFRKRSKLDVPRSPDVCIYDLINLLQGLNYLPEEACAILPKCIKGEFFRSCFNGDLCKVREFLSSVEKLSKIEIFASLCLSLVSRHTLVALNIVQSSAIAKLDLSQKVIAFQLSAHEELLDIFMHFCETLPKQSIVLIVEGTLVDAARSQTNVMALRILEFFKGGDLSQSSLSEALLYAGNNRNQVLLEAILSSEHSESLDLEYMEKCFSQAIVEKRIGVIYIIMDSSRGEDFRKYITPRINYYRKLSKNSGGKFTISSGELSLLLDKKQIKPAKPVELLKKYFPQR